MNETVIKIENLTKEYRLGVINAKTLKAEFSALLAKLSGKENPNRKIGSTGKKGFFNALDNINLEIKKGETVGIIGRNGAGKSTLLKVLSRITTPTSGNAYIKGRISSMLEVGTGFHPELTGRENIYLNGAILGMTKEEITEKLDDIIDFSECREFIDTPVKRYSSGMYVKLAFSVAAHLSSEILIMDEVLAVGDASFQQKCIDKMLSLAKSENRTILYVSHNMSTIQKLCTRAIVLEKGKIIEDSDTETAIKAYLSSRENAVYKMTFADNGHKININSPITEVSAEYVSKSIDVSDKEPLTLKLSWKNKNDITDLSMRLTIYDHEKHPVATSVLNNFYTGNAGEVAEKTLSFDLSALKAGEYETRYTFFYLKGNMTDLYTTMGLSFNKLSSLEETKMRWYNKVWGAIELPPPIEE